MQKNMGWRYSFSYCSYKPVHGKRLIVLQGQNTRVKAASDLIEEIRVARGILQLGGKSNGSISVEADIEISLKRNGWHLNDCRSESHFGCEIGILNVCEVI